MPHFLLCILSSFRESWRSAVAAAHDLILVGIDGKCQFVVDITDFKTLSGILSVISLNVLNATVPLQQDS